MLRILFICHGNICRSPMAEFIMTDLVDKKGLSDKFDISSAGTSSEELGNPVHPGTRQILNKLNIDSSKKHAIYLNHLDCNSYDYLIAMDSMNLRNIKRQCNLNKNNKVFRLLEFANINRDISDPWYSGNFTKTYNDVKLGCESFLDYILKNNQNL